MAWTSTLTGSNPDVQRTNLIRERKYYGIALASLKVWDAMETNLPGTAANDDCAIITGTAGTDMPTIQAGDFGLTTIARKFGLEFCLPPEYDDGQVVLIRISAACLTTIADNYCRADFQVYEGTRAGAVGADLCTTAATSINSLTHADYDFVVTATGLAAGDRLHIVGNLEADDAGDLGVMIPEIAVLEIGLDVKG